MNEIYTLSLHDALPISNPESKIIKAESKITVDNPEWIKGKRVLIVEDGPTLTHGEMNIGAGTVAVQDRKSTRLNSSHVAISYAVFCLKKKKTVDFLTKK